MKLRALLSSCTLLARVAAVAVQNNDAGVTYEGIRRDGIDVFYSVPYGQDTGGANRFKPPKPFVAKAGTSIRANSQGAVCPQPRGDYFSPLYLSNVTEISEDCLHLNIYRPAGISSHANVPVMLHIHGGSFFIGSKDELVIQPEGLVLRSVQMGLPVIFVTISYRLGGMCHLVRFSLDTHTT